jgi:hypothetical protein
MSVLIEWQTIDNEDDELWDESRVLYAYVHEGDILYLGKAWSTTVAGRWSATDKQAVLDHIELELGIDVGELDVMIGIVEADQRLTDELLADLESLLIFRIGPPTNVQNTRSRSISRPGLAVSCGGDWPLRQKRYIDT